MRVACAVLLLTGCVHTLSFVPSGVPYASHPNVSPSEVRLYRPGDALPAFTELGYLEVDQIATDGTVEEAVWVQSMLAREAAANGCNAVVIHDSCARVTSDSRVTQSLPRTAATCIWVADR